jgi:hypothetical protein
MEHNFFYLIKQEYKNLAKSTTQNPALISFIDLRRTVGSLGIGLPFVLLAGSFVFGECNNVKPSISDYYYTNMREIFVGILCAISLFLFTYKGYSKLDNWSANVAAFFALGIAFFPTTYHCGIDCEKDITNFTNHSYNSIIHFTSATIFFLTLAYMSISLFTKTNNKNQENVLTEQKIFRNKIYVWCGWIIIASLVIIFLHQKNILPSALPITFIFESVALVAFGMSWLTKGEALFGDNKNKKPSNR